MKQYEAALEARDAEAMLAALADLEARFPTEIRWPFERGCLYGEFGQDEEAIKAFQQVLTLDPDHLDSLVNLGRHLDDTHQHEEALACYDRALTLPGGAEDAICWSNRGNTLLAMDRFEEGLESVERSLAIDPEGPALRARQTALGYLGRVDEANAARAEGPFDRGPFVQRTHDLGDKRLVIRWWAGQHTRPDWLEEAAAGLMEWVASLADKEPGLADGVSLQFGWTGLMIRERGDDLVICEPDFAFDPWARRNWDVGFTLQTEIMQHMLLEMCELELCPATMHEVVAVDPEALQAPQVQMYRLHESEKGFTGWLVGAPGAFEGEIDPAHFRPMRSGDLSRLRHPLIKAMLLPPRHVVSFQDHAVTSVKSPTGVELWDR